MRELGYGFKGLMKSKKMGFRWGLDIFSTGEVPVFIERRSTADISRDYLRDMKILARWMFLCKRCSFFQPVDPRSSTLHLSRSDESTCVCVIRSFLKRLRELLEIFRSLDLPPSAVAPVSHCLWSFYGFVGTIKQIDHLSRNPSPSISTQLPGFSVLQYVHNSMRSQRGSGTIRVVPYGNKPATWQRQCVKSVNSHKSIAKSRNSFLFCTNYAIYFRTIFGALYGGQQVWRK